jgi:D-glycerate 3-kinase
VTNPYEGSATLAAAWDLLERQLDVIGRRPFVFGLCGAQGSGKSTLSEALAARARAEGIGTAVLSLDDLYLPKAVRERLAEEIHPLLQTRGVPGTHEVALGVKAIASLEAGRAAALPRFDKGRDDRRPADEWEEAPPGTELLIFEGWCVGARPQEEEALTEPVNPLERDEDRQGIWRRYVNDHLAGEYQQLFGRIDILMLLAAPSFDVVHGWRVQQEHDLRTRSGPTAGMSDEAIGRFIQHYERLTRHILSEMPQRADLLVRLDEDRSPVSIEGG